MANDGTVKIGAEIDEKEFKSGLSKVSKVYDIFQCTNLVPESGYIPTYSLKIFGLPT